jgi:probable F420-dependent oxidoreductase
VRFILQYPETSGLDGDMLDAGDVGETAARAEANGFAGFAFTDHPAPGANWLTHGGHQTLDPFVALAFAAAATERLRLVTYLSVVPYRNPLLLAKSAATLDRLSGGRFVLGLGGGYHKTEFFALGVDFAERNELFDEALDVLPLAWSGRPFSYAGRHFEARDVVQLPPPAQRPIPIWIGGNSRLARRRVVAHAQGWIPMLGPPELARSAKTTHVATLDELGALIAEMRDQAGARADDLEFVSSYLDLTLQSDPASDVERHREEIARHEAAGVTWMIVGGRPTTRERHHDFIAAFGATYAGAAS